MKEEISPYELILKQMHMFTVVGRVKAPIYICSRVAALGLHQQEEPIRRL